MSDQNNVENLPLLTVAASEREKLRLLANTLHVAGSVNRRSVGGHLYGLVSAAQFIGVDLPELLASLRVEWNTQKQEKEKTP